jgi:hypothetical protein
MPSVPRGTAEGTLSIGGSTRRGTGIGYRDHNLGNAALPRLVYEYEDGTRRSRITFRRTADLMCTKFVDLLTGFKRFLAMLAGFDGGEAAETATLERFEGGKVAETVSQESAVWELMYFGRAP